MKQIPLLLAVLLAFIPNNSFAADYTHDDACTVAGAWHQTNDASGSDFLICDGANWKSALYFPTAGNILQIDNDPAAGNAGCIRYEGTGGTLQFSNDCSSFSDFGGGGGGALNDLSDVTTEYVTNFNMFLGQGAGSAATGATENSTAIGFNTLNANVLSNFSTAVGAYAAESYAATNAYQSLTAIGMEAAQNVTHGFGLLAVGNEALKNMQGDRNTAIGSLALFSGGSGDENTAVGADTGAYMSGNGNVLIGNKAAKGGFSGDFDHRGDNNVIIGNDAAADMTGNTNDQNVIVGSGTAQSLRNGQSNILIGYNIDVTSGTAANELNIANVIYGTGLYGTGNIGINDPTPDVALDVVGDINYTGVITDVSDRRAKENIIPLEQALEGILALQGYTFSMKGDADSKIEYGLIAQEVEVIFPELVITDSDGLKTLNYMGVIAPLVEAVKAQHIEITAQKATIDGLDTRLRALEDSKPQITSRAE